VYFGTARGDVMCALQRIGYVSRNTDKFLTGKVGGPVAVARRGGQTLTLQEMLMFFLINDMIVPGSSYWNMVFGRLPGEALDDAEGVATVRHFASNVAELVKKLNS
jgi:multimeric flavodoxin WrbA